VLDSNLDWRSSAATEDQFLLPDTEASLQLAMAASLQFRNHNDPTVLLYISMTILCNLSARSVICIQCDIRDVWRSHCGHCEGSNGAETASPAFLRAWFLFLTYYITSSVKVRWYRKYPNFVTNALLFPILAPQCQKYITNDVFLTD
jgi:hypothetical protein